VSICKKRKACARVITVWGLAALGTKKNECLSKKPYKTWGGKGENALDVKTEKNKVLHLSLDSILSGMAISKWKRK